MLAGLITPEAGTDVGRRHRRRVARPREVLARMGVLSDSRGLYPRLTARENIVYYGALQGMERDAADARAQDLARMFDMTAPARPPHRGLQPGRADEDGAGARALVHDPANIVLDEPTNGLDVLATRACATSLRWLRTPAGGAQVHRLLDPHHAGGRAPRATASSVVAARPHASPAGTVAELLARDRPERLRGGLRPPRVPARAATQLR